MTFIDTSAIYALADRADPNHMRAIRCFATLLRSGSRLLTHNYVLIESMALLQHRLGLAAALSLAENAGAFEIEWITPTLHAAGVAALAETGSNGVSLVDQVSFAVMKQRGASRAFAFDDEFAARGFELIDG